jgi:hypothetical protein
MLENRPANNRPIDVHTWKDTECELETKTCRRSISTDLTIFVQLFRPGVMHPPHSLGLIHVEVTLEYAFLECVGHFWLFGHLSVWRFHDCDALGTLVSYRLWHRSSG